MLLLVKPMMWSLTLVDPSLLAQPHNDGAAGGGSVTWYSLHLIQTGSCVKAPCLCSAALSLACLLRTQTKTSPQPPVVSKLLPQLRTLFSLLNTRTGFSLGLVSAQDPTRSSHHTFTWVGAGPSPFEQLMFLPHSHRSSCCSMHWPDRPVARRNT